MKLLLRILLLAVCAVILVTGFIAGWSWKNLATLNDPLDITEPVFRTTDLVTVILMRLLFLP